MAQATEQTAFYEPLISFHMLALLSAVWNRFDSEITRPHYFKPIWIFFFFLLLGLANVRISLAILSVHTGSNLTQWHETFHFQWEWIISSNLNRRDCNAEVENNQTLKCGQRGYMIKIRDLLFYNYNYIFFQMLKQHFFHTNIYIYMYVCIYDLS